MVLVILGSVVLEAMVVKGRMGRVGEGFGSGCEGGAVLAGARGDGGGRETAIGGGDKADEEEGDGTNGGDGEGRGDGSDCNGDATNKGRNEGVSRYGMGDGGESVSDEGRNEEGVGACGGDGRGGGGEGAGRGGHGDGGDGAGGGGEGGSYVQKRSLATSNKHFSLVTE